MAIQSAVLDDSGWFEKLAPFGSTIVAPTVGLKVGKSGRTTGATKAAIESVANVLNGVDYDTRGSAPFRDVIFIKNTKEGARPSKPGDSGSL
jgi:hypothetical protein